MAALTSAERDALPDSDFIFEDTREYPYQNAEHARKALQLGAQHASPEQLAIIKRKVKARYPGIKVKKSIRKAQLGRPVDIRVPVWKDDAKQIVYGVVLVPDQVDSQGDVISKTEIEKAAHDFMERSRQHDVQHSEITLGQGGKAIAAPVESYIAPADFEIAGQKVLKGSWVMATHVTDPETWQKVVKHELDGYSIGGIGDRTPITA